MADLIYYGGQGYDGLPEHGKYTVKYDEGNEEAELTFNKLSKAREFYDSLDTGKAMWIENPTELIDCHISTWEMIGTGEDNEMPF